MSERHRAAYSDGSAERNEVNRQRGARLIVSGCGAAWLARLLGVQEVPGSNPGSPTNTLKGRLYANNGGQPAPELI
jgi:hypothetical protein